MQPPLISLNKALYKFHRSAAAERRQKIEKNATEPPENIIDSARSRVTATGRYRSQRFGL